MLSVLRFRVIKLKVRTIRKIVFIEFIHEVKRGFNQIWRFSSPGHRGKGKGGISVMCWARERV